MKYLVTLILLHLTILSFSQQKLLISEVSSRNDQLLIDEDGDDPDWIEIYNADTSNIDLTQYYLSDDKDQPTMWRFPDIQLESGHFLIVFASAKDKSDIINHWETPLNGDSLWKYLNPTEQSYYDYLHWSDSDFSDQNWEWKRGGFGTGYNNIETISSDTLPCIYLRNEFFLSDTSQIMALSLHAYFDDGFTVFLNGYEILREHMLADGIKPAYSKTAFPSHLSNIDSELPPQRFDIEPLLWKNLLKNGRNVLAIQNHNFWNHFPLVIKPWLSMAIKDSIVQTIAFDTSLSKPNIPLHTNFKINGDGEKIYLFNENGEMIQKLDVPHLQANHSYGILPNNTDSLVIFQIPSPGSVNSSNGFKAFVQDTCVLSSPSGFYQDSVFVELLHQASHLKAYFTLDGSIPDTDSHLYDTAFYIDSTVVFRVRYFDEQLLPGPISNYSWFINENSDLEVYSLITDPHNLWDEEEGIYTYGTGYWPNKPYFGANFWQNWERNIHIQAFNKNAELNWTQDAGVKIHGNYTRQLDQKSLGFYAKGKYGNDLFKHKLFNQKPYLTESKRFLLRNAGNDHYFAHYRDLLVHLRMQGTHLDVQVGRPITTYINGDYWGIYHLREKIDRFYLQYNKGVDPEEVNLLEQNALIINGDRNSFELLLEFIKNNNLNNNTNYNFIANQIDIENWIDLYIANLYHFNTDWPHHNSKFWSAPHHKWQQILVDLDVTMGLTNNNMAYKNPLPLIHDDSLSYLAIFYKELLKNDQFKRQYFNRFADLLNTIFLPEEYLPLADSLKASMTQEMIKHADRWNMNYNNWLNGVGTQNIIDFIEYRGDYMRSFLRGKYELGTYDTINLSVEPAGKGVIKLNTIKINTNNWQGLYFDSVAVSLEAVPNPGYEFIRWESSTTASLSDSSRIIEHLFLKSNEDITAVFYSESGTEDTLQVFFSEINYRKWEYAESGDWIELYNKETDTVDISNWILKGNKPFKEFQFPENSFIAPESYIILVQDTNSFSKWHKDTPYFGPFGFDLMEEESEIISVYDDLERLVCSINFTDKNPWPDNQNTSKTIELIDINQSYRNADNWQLGCPGGSPGLAPQNCYQESPLLITEINYKSAANYQTGDWFEVYNNTEDLIDLSSWILQDSDIDNRLQLSDSLYIFPNEYFLFIQDTASFFNHHKKEGRFFGPINFGLSASEDEIQFLNPFAQEIIQLEYTDDSPWPDEDDSEGQTIELMSTDLDFHQGENWQSNCFLGTPWHNTDWCVQASSIWISEIKYQSAPNEETADWIELYNSNQREVDLQNWQLIIQGDSLRIANSFLISGESYQILTADSLLFYSVYDTNITTYQLEQFDLQSAEEQISIIDPFRFPGQILNYNYLLNWPVFQSDTNNRTLELVQYSNPYNPANWRAGCEFGTPGKSPEWCNTDAIIENESIFGLRLSPNPFNDELWINMELQRPEKLQIIIYDLQGKIKYSSANKNYKSGTHTIPLSLERLIGGIYILKVQGESASIQTKVIKLEE